MLCVSDLPFILLSTSGRIYSISKESKFTAVFQLINTETQHALLLCPSQRFMTYVSSYIVSKIYLKKHH